MLENILIQHATLSDMAAMLEWRGNSNAMQQAITRDFTMVSTGKNTIFLAMLEQELIGTIQIMREHTDDDMIRQAVYLEALEVHKDYRQRGIAQKLCQEVEQQTRLEGISRVTVSVEPTNTPSLNLFLKRGFRQFKESSFEWDGKQFPVVCLEKIINSEFI